MAQNSFMTEPAYDYSYESDEESAQSDSSSEYNVPTECDLCYEEATVYVTPCSFCRESMHCCMNCVEGRCICPKCVLKMGAVPRKPRAKVLWNVKVAQ
jgi:hypothetical protein